jgi:hypothetical protein
MEPNYKWDVRVIGCDAGRVCVVLGPFHDVKWSGGVAMCKL